MKCPGAFVKNTMNIAEKLTEVSCPILLVRTVLNWVLRSINLCLIVKLSRGESFFNLRRGQTFLQYRDQVSFYSLYNETTTNWIDARLKKITGISQTVKLSLQSPLNKKLKNLENSAQIFRICQWFFSLNPFWFNSNHPCFVFSPLN